MTGGIHATIQVHRGSFALDADIEAPPGQVTAIVGPNGSGKSTLLRAIAGLAPIDRGSIRIGDCVVDDADGAFIAAEDRSIGVVFQDYLLFPHMTVRDNVAFGLRARGVRTRAARARADESLHEFGLVELATRRPSQISGGQAQRIALARALITHPDALLLDEPFAALDAGTRVATRADLSRRLSDFTGATLLVTHEPLEALVLADRVVVLEEGRVVQAGTMADVAARPASAYVAALMGVNLLRGSAHDGRVTLRGGGELIVASTMQGEVFATIRPSAVTAHRQRPEGSARNVWPARVRTVEEIGDRVRVSFDGQPDLLVDLTAASVASLSLAPGAQCWLTVKATEIDVYPAASSPESAEPVIRP